MSEMTFYTTDDVAEIMQIYWEYESLVLIKDIAIELYRKMELEPVFAENTKL